MSLSQSISCMRIFRKSYHACIFDRAYALLPSETGSQITHHQCRYINTNTYSQSALHGGIRSETTSIRKVEARASAANWTTHIKKRGNRRGGCRNRNGKNVSAVNGNRSYPDQEKYYLHKLTKPSKQHFYKPTTLEFMLKEAKETLNYEAAITEAERLLDSRTLNYKDGITVIHIFKQAKLPTKCGYVLQYLREEKCRMSIKHYTPAIAAFAAAKQANNAYKLFCEMKSLGIQPNMITYSHVINACHKSNDWELALALFEDMKRTGVPLGGVVYGVVIASCAKGKQWEKALELFDEMKLHGVERNTITYSSVISACGNAGKWEECIKLLRMMEENNVARDNITYCSVIAACTKGGEWETAIEVLRDMETNGIVPNTIAYSSTLSACVRGGAWNIALELFNEMKKKGVTRDTIAYSSAISACEKGGNAEMALQLFLDMGDIGLERNLIVYKTVIEALGRQGERNDIVDQIYDILTYKYTSVYPLWERVREDGGLLDLHLHTKNMARAAVRKLLKILLKESHKEYRGHKIRLKAIIVGQSEKGAVKSTVKSELEQLTPPIHTSFNSHNMGRIYLDKEDLECWLTQNMKLHS